ncbi:MAG: immunity 22 family protein [Saprospiraceae bacterium]
MKIQFWAGNFSSKMIFDSFFKESYFEDDSIPISEFAKSQDETWIDYDFLEIGFENEDKSIKNKFSEYSYSESWTSEFEKRIIIKNFQEVNSIVIGSFDNEEKLIEFPKSVFLDDFRLEYLGVIEF